MMECTWTFLQLSRSGSWFEPGSIEPNKDYAKQILELSTFLSNAKAYLGDSSKERNLV
jgi:hypothetical protein